MSAIEFLFKLINEFPVVASLSLIVGVCSICLNAILFWRRMTMNKKYEAKQNKYIAIQNEFIISQKKYKELRDFAKKKRQILRWWDGNIMDLINNLSQVKAQTGSKKKLRDSIQSIHMLKSELVILTEDIDALNYSKSLGYLVDRYSSEAIHYHVLFQLAKSNIPENEEDWNTPRNLLNDILSNIEVENSAKIAVGTSRPSTDDND